MLKTAKTDNMYRYIVLCGYVATKVNSTIQDSEHHANVLILCLKLLQNT